jgi:hypothetical protein
MAEVGQTSRHAMDVVERIATNHRPAARLLVVPIGESCSHVCLGETVDGAEPIDKAMRDAIEAPEPVEIGPSGIYRILISEVDLMNRSCKFTILGEPAASDDHRINGEITDPIFHTPGNPYTAAMNAQRPISVIAKPQIKDGDIEKLYISDIAPSTPLIAAS